MDSKETMENLIKQGEKAKRKKLTRKTELVSFNPKKNYVFTTIYDELWNHYFSYLNSLSEGIEEINIKYQKKSIRALEIPNENAFKWLQQNAKSPFDIFHEIRKKGANNRTGPWTKLKT